jgi:hypothetical protein
MSTKAEAKPYRMEDVYALSDRVFHEGFNDTGIVVEIGTTSDKASKCVVDFEKVGRKRLIMGLQH